MCGSLDCIIRLRQQKNTAQKIYKISFWKFFLTMKLYILKLSYVSQKWTTAYLSEQHVGNIICQFLQQKKIDSTSQPQSKVLVCSQHY